MSRAAKEAAGEVWAMFYAARAKHPSMTDRLKGPWHKNYWPYKASEEFHAAAAKEWERYSKQAVRDGDI